MLAFEGTGPIYEVCLTWDHQAVRSAKSMKRSWNTRHHVDREVSLGTPRFQQVIGKATMDMETPVPTTLEDQSEMKDPRSLPKLLTGFEESCIVFLILFFKHIYLAVLGLNSGMWTLNCSMWDLDPWAGMEPGPPAFGPWSHRHWTTRKPLYGCLIYCFWKVYYSATDKENVFYLI